MFQARTDLEGHEYTFRLTDEGKLFVKPLTKPAAVRLCSHTKHIDIAEKPEEYVAYLAELPEVELKDKKGWVYTCYEVPRAYTEPYLQKYDEWFGGKPKGEYIPFLRNPLIHTHISFGAHYDPETETFVINGFACQYGEYDLDRAQESFKDSWNADLGHRKHEQQYIHAGGETYRYNPNYGHRHHRAQPGWDYGGYRTDVAKAIWYSWQDRWKETASPAQLDLFNNINMCFGKPPRIRLEDYNVYVTDPLGKCNYDGKGKMVQHYGPKEFKAKLAYFTGGK